MNYTDRRKAEQCKFYNSDFLIYSSMGSFYIPCVVMVLLYWRIFRVIRERSRRKKARSKKAKASSAAPALPNAFAAIAANKRPAATRTTSDASATDNNSTKELLPTSASPNLALTKTTIAEETSFTNYNAKLTATDTEDGGSVNDSVSGAAMGGASTYAAQEHSSRASDSGGSHADGGVHHTPNKTRYSAPDTVVVDLQYGSATASRNNANSAVKKNGVKAAPPATAHARRTMVPGHHNVAKSVTKFNFRLRHSKKKTDRSAKKRERKATKTLAIVLGEYT